MRSYRARLLTPEGPESVRWCDDAVVRVDENGRIVGVGHHDGGPVDEDLRPGVLLPGFVDGHVHYAQARIVGSATGPLLDWLERTVFPEERLFADPRHAEQVAEIFARRLAAAGTTFAFVYGPVHAEAADTLFRTLDRRGLRAVVGPVLMDAHCPEALCRPPEVALRDMAALADRWHGHDGRLEVAVIPRFALSCTSRMLEGAAALARDRGLWVSTHLSENPDEVELACRRFGAPDYLTVYERAGLLHQRALFAHCVHLDAAEWDRFAAAGAVVAHCPDSNDFLGSGGMSPAEPLARDIPVAVGSDVGAGRSFRIPRILSSAYDNGLRRGVPLDPRRLLWWGTRGGASALGQDRIGAIEEGFDADMVLFEVPPWAEDASSVLASVIFDHDAPPPLRTWVRGRVVWARSDAPPPAS